MLLSGIFTKAVMYIMLLCDSIIAGYFVGEAGVKSEETERLFAFFENGLSNDAFLLYNKRRTRGQAKQLLSFL